MAKVIEETQRPALILAPNKTLAAQLYGEFKSFFPDNAVEYFVSYYDYYQPEAYIPRTDTYIEKDSSINEQIDRMRHAATRALLGARRRDHRGLGLLHLRYRLGRDLFGDDVLDPGGRPRLAAAIAGRSRGAAIPAQQHRLRARRFPGARRHHRAVPGPPGGPRLAHLHVRRRGGEHRRVRSAHGREDARPRAGEDLREFALCDAEADAEPGDHGHSAGVAGAAAALQRHRPAAGGAAAGAAHAVRPGDDRGDRLLPRHRELFALADGPPAGRAAAHAVRISARQRAGLRGRKPRHRAADRRHVLGRLPAQIDARRVRLPAAVLPRQPAAALRGMGRDAAAIHVRLGHARQVGDRRRPAACSWSR